MYPALSWSLKGTILNSDSRNFKYFLRPSGQSAPTLGQVEFLGRFETAISPSPNMVRQSVENCFGYFEVGLLLEMP